QRLASKTPAPGPAVPPVPIAVVGFPLGAMHTKAKCEETRVAVEEGAQEIDMVLAVGWLKEQKFEAVFQDIAAVVNQCGPNVPTKLIIETALLNDVEKIRACVLGVWAGVKFVKTSTGFAANGATVSDVALMRNVVGDQVGVKASGGIRTAADALAMLQAGATRLGVSSSVAILNELRTGTSSAGSSCSY
ncbi:MAG TPA: deoxyribose-phosphate aldolase, partial [Oligoflexia bacterium]|nr:deoxyribose-phosphate aldolase [Oligoflexia bacterium]